MIYSKNDIIALLDHNDSQKAAKAAQRGLCRIAQRQTEDEREARETKHSNGVGFAGPDAKAGTALSAWMTCGRHDGIPVRPLTGRMFYRGQWVERVEVARIMARRYAGQLADIANELSM